MQVFIHYFLHIGFPLLIALAFFKKEWKKTYLIFLASMLVDLDHLLASPIFQGDRCSIHFHPLHSYYAIGFYVLLLFFRKPFKLIGLGLIMHMGTDLIDCLMTHDRCPSCLLDSPALALIKTISNFINIFI